MQLYVSIDRNDGITTKPSAKLLASTTELTALVGTLMWMTFWLSSCTVSQRIRILVSSLFSFNRHRYIWSDYTSLVL